MKIFNKLILICFFSVLFFGFGTCIFAYVMSSGNYKIQSDSALSPAGGMGSSANYIFQDTMGQVSSGESNSDSYKIKAGFQEMQEVSLAVTSPGNTNLTPDIPGVSGGTANANTHWNVQTDNAAGFDMKISASTNPAMKLPPDGTYYFDDYPTTPTFGWNIGTDAAKFGFNIIAATPSDATLAFQDNGSACGYAGNTGNCWSGFFTSPISIIHREVRTSANGEDEQIAFQAQSNKLLESGNYSAQITVTVSAN